MVKEPTGAPNPEHLKYSGTSSLNIPNLLTNTTVFK